jgi:hypothetical protein
MDIFENVKQIDKQYIDSVCCLKNKIYGKWNLIWQAFYTGI